MSLLITESNRALLRFTWKTQKRCHCGILTLEDTCLETAGRPHLEVCLWGQEYTGAPCFHLCSGIHSARNDTSFIMQIVQYSKVIFFWFNLKTDFSLTSKPALLWHVPMLLLRLCKMDNINMNAEHTIVFYSSITHLFMPLVFIKLILYAERKGFPVQCTTQKWCAALNSIFYFGSLWFSLPSFIYSFFEVCVSFGHCDLF